MRRLRRLKMSETTLFVAGLFYLLMNGVVSLIFNRLNRRMAYYKD